MMSLFPTIITKEIFRRNVVFTSFVGGIATVVARMGASECIILALEKECYDLVGVASGG